MSLLAGSRAYLRVVLRQLLRNRRRTALTFSGLVVSFFLYTSLQALLATLDAFLQRAGSATVLAVRPRSEFGQFLPEVPRHYAAQLRELPGVMATSPVRFHIGQGRQDDVPAVVLGVEAQNFHDTSRPIGVSLADLQRLRSERGAALAGRGLLERNRWQVGSRVTVRGLGQAPSVAVRIVGAIDADELLSDLLLVDIDYLEEIVGDAGRATFIEARIERPEFAAALARAIDERFANSTVPTETTTQRTDFSTALANLADAFAALRAISYLTLAVTVLVVGNSISMSIRERTVEIGTLRALGFARARVAQMVIGESVVVSLAGALAGALAVYALYNSGAVQPLALVRLEVTVPNAVFAEVALLAIPIGVLAALPTLWSALRMPIARALRSAV